MYWMLTWSSRAMALFKNSKSLVETKIIANKIRSTQYIKKPNQARNHLLAGFHKG